MSSKKEVDVVFTAIAQQLEAGVEFLIARRLSGVLEGQYTFPGGKRDPGQTLVKCAVSEINEETGLSVLESELTRVPGYHVGLRGKSGRDLRLYLFWCNYHQKMGTPVTREPAKHDAWRFESFDNIARLIIKGEMHPVILFMGMLEDAVGYSPLLKNDEAQRLTRLLYYMYHPEDAWYYSEPKEYTSLNTI